MSLLERHEFEYHKTERRIISPAEYRQNVWERVRSPTREFPSGMPVQDGLFVDNTFDLQHMNISHNVVLKRPREICDFPQFMVDGASRLDICQGILSDCWFLSAVASLSLYPSLMQRVVPPDQSFQKGYDGSFIFQFWQYGKWYKVQVDDRLPTVEGKLIYLRSSNKNEFWCSLLEKAYAKLKGGYTALSMGFPHEAMVDMTGGITEVFNVLSLPRHLGSFLRPLLQKGALINCANSQGELETDNGFGIMFLHAYSVTALEKIQTKYGPIELVRVNNPWGKIEWTGPWSDKGKEWDDVSKEEQDRVQRSKLDDGEFWMALQDFRMNFDHMEVCHLSEDTLSVDGVIKRPWHCTLYDGEWIPSKSPPQYHLTLLEEDDDPSDSKQACAFLLALMQKQNRTNFLPLDLQVYKVASEGSQDLSGMTLALDYSRQNRCREIVLRCYLAPGHYIIIPKTSEKRTKGEFFLRVLTEKGNQTVPVKMPSTDEIAFTEPLSPRPSGLPSIPETKELFRKHSTKGSFCRPLDLFNLLTEAIASGVLAGSEKMLSLELCKSFVVLMDIKGTGFLDWTEFQIMWEKLRKWTGVFMTFDLNKNRTLEHQEIPQALTAAGIKVDDFIMQLISRRYTEPDMTISFPGFLFLLLKLECMINCFRSFDAVGMGRITMNCRQFLTMAMYS